MGGHRPAGFFVGILSRYSDGVGGPIGGCSAGVLAEGANEGFPPQRDRLDDYPPVECGHALAGLLMNSMILRHDLRGISPNLL